MKKRLYFQEFFCRCSFSFIFFTIMLLLTYSNTVAWESWIWSTFIKITSDAPNAVVGEGKNMLLFSRHGPWKMILWYLKTLLCLQCICYCVIFRNKVAFAYNSVLCMQYVQLYPHEELYFGCPTCFRHLLMRNFS